MFMLVSQSSGVGAMTGATRGGAAKIGALCVVALGVAPMFCVAFSTEPAVIVCAASWNHWGVWVTIAAATMVVDPILMVRVAPAINPSM